MRSSKGPRARARSTVVGVAVAILVGALAGCSESGDSKAGSADSGDSTPSSTEPVTLEVAQERLDAAYAGMYEAPPADTPAPPPDKDVWVIAYDLSQTFAEQFVNGTEEAADILGWTLKSYDAKGDPNTALAGIRSAVAAKADGIIIEIFDCDALQSGVSQAKDAGIKVITDGGVDCDPPLFDAGTTFLAGGYPGNDGSPAQYLQALMKPSADWIAVKTDGEAKVIEVVMTDTFSTRSQAQGFEDELAEVCSSCSIVDRVEFVSSEFGPVLQQKVQQSLLQHPDANAVANTVADSAGTGGIAAAVLASGRDVLVTGGEGVAPNIEMIHNQQGQDTATCYSNGWGAFSAFDQLIRLFDGAPPGTSSGNGFVHIDRDHNLPPIGEDCVPMKDGEVLDYASLYQETWGK